MESGPRHRAQMDSRFHNRSLSHCVIIATKADAGTFTFNKEGHTAGELLRMQLLRDHQVQYAGYQLPHPLEHRMLIKVQTTGQTAAPVDVLKAAIVDLQGETEALDRGFRDGVAAVRERQMQI